MPRELSETEVRNAFLDHVWELIGHWQSVKLDSSSEAERARERLEGLAHDILCMLDGGSALPCFIVAPDPHPDERLLALEAEHDWYPENFAAVQCVKSDIAGLLHEKLYDRRRKRLRPSPAQAATRAA